MTVTVDGFHDGKRRSTYSAANFDSVGPEGGRGFAAALFVGKERERRGSGLIGPHRTRLAEGDAPRRLAAAAVPEHPGPGAVQLDTEQEPLQGGVMDRVLALARVRPERQHIGQVRFVASNTEPSARCECPKVVAMSAWPSSPATTEDPRRR